MVTSYMDYTSPDVEYFFDINRNRLNTRNAENFINRLGRDNLNTLGNTSLLDIYLSRGHVIEPHYHQNASELVYCISGSAIVSLINPFTNQVANIPIAPGQVANIPQGWWHWEIASQNKTHLLAIFDAPYPEYIFGSDLLTKTPIEVLAHTYCLDPHLLKQALAPLQGPSIVIGPTDECLQSNIYGPKKSNSHPLPKDHNMPQNPYAQDSRYSY
ncbi:MULTISPECIES: cupin domain-containing protein [unclassified Sporolactobacillus]|uniref:cupin domain-containing protein n=1 Tax=unclassified Sporolactobacillus TaxID=2628533 RepID=UPI002FBDD14B